MIDEYSGLEIRLTDNGIKECDLPGINQEPKPIEVDENGLPVGWQSPKGGDNGNG